MQDLISRQAAKLKVARVTWADGDSHYDFHDKCVDCLDDVPPVTPQPKTGHWEYTKDDYDPNVGNWHCSECKDIVVKCLTMVAEGRIPRYKYCSNCGCRMIKPQESEDKLDGDPVDIDKAVEHYEGTLETLKGIDLEVDG